MTEQAEIKYDNPPFNSKWKNIKFLNRWGLVVSGGLTTITLFITWIFFTSVYRSNVDELLAEISNNGFNCNFVVLTLSMYVFMLVFVGILVMPFIFLKKYNAIMIMIAVACLVVSGILLIFMISFGGLASAGFRAYITKNGVVSILFFVIPWIFTIIFSGSTIGFSCWLIIIFFSNDSKSIFLNQRSLIKQQSEVSHDLHDSSDSSTLVTMENNELLSEIENEPITLSSIDQQEVPRSIPNKHSIRKKNDDESDFQSLETIRLQVQPDSLPAVLPTSSNSEPIEPKTEKKLDEHDNKPKFNREPIAIKIQKKTIPELPSNKRVIIGVTETPVLRAQVSQPLHQIEKNLNVKDVTLPIYQEPTPFVNDEIAPAMTVNNQTQVVIKQSAPFQGNTSTSQSVAPSSINPSPATNQSPLMISIHELPEPKSITTDNTANLKISSSDSPPSVQQEWSNEQFVKNVYPLKAPVQGVPPPPLPPSVNQETTIIGVTEMSLLKAQVSQPINPQPPELELPKKPTLPLKVWTKEQINTAWERGLITPTYEAEAYRSDYAGALMFKGSFIANPNVEENNNVRSYSWTIVYQRPLVAGGTEETSNLWPLNCINALAKGQDYPKWQTTITFNGRQNVLKNKKWKGKRRLRKVKT
ncbi:hypothetical protein [Spiroplasma endosymbiont of Virgichneumon dumeticola]|uniref:hypothetical protein n=1 Tax=Spiroplasma endosymbiont of Virgichneumon dumeticola TaxID=3139323 RepID=UPI0035C933CC